MGIEEILVGFPLVFCTGLVCHCWSRPCPATFTPTPAVVSLLSIAVFTVCVPIPAVPIFSDILPVMEHHDAESCLLLQPTTTLRQCHGTGSKALLRVPRDYHSGHSCSWQQSCQTKGSHWSQVLRDFYCSQSRAKLLISTHLNYETQDEIWLSWTI